MDILVTLLLSQRLGLPIYSAKKKKSLDTHFKSPLKKKVKKINEAEFKIFPFSSATPFKHMNFSRNGNKRSMELVIKWLSICSKCQEVKL
jgi:hypothetical protein